MRGNQNGRTDRPQCRHYSYIVNTYDDYEHNILKNSEYFITQRDLVNHLGLSLSSVYKLLKGEKVNKYPVCEIIKKKTPIENAISSL
jgi:hypothetical protein